LNSSREYTIPVSGIRRRSWLPELGLTDTLLYCSRYTKALEETVSKANRAEDCYVSIVPLTLAAKKGLEAAEAAHLAAFLAYRRGASIARKKGIDTLLMLVGMRNIRSVLDRAAPKPGDQVLILATPSDCLAIDTVPGHTCRLPPSTRDEVSRVACFVLEARLYRPEEQ